MGCARMSPSRNTNASIPSSTTDRVDVFELDEGSIGAASRYAHDAGVADRVTFSVSDASNSATADRYELVAISEARHDMSRPVDALRAARRILQDGGSLLVADERVDDEFTAPAPLLERHAYGWSVISCLPNAMNAPLTAATGVTRPSTLRRYATAAGSSEVHVLLIGLLVTPAAAGAHGACGIYDTATAAPDGHHIVESHYNYEAAARPGRLGLGGDHLHLQR
jgi:hypothetical protein